jgi:hypothetical protein
MLEQQIILQNKISRGELKLRQVDQTRPNSCQHQPQLRPATVIIAYTEAMRDGLVGKKTANTFSTSSPTTATTCCV